MAREARPRFSRAGLSRCDGIRWRARWFIPDLNLSGARVRECLEEGHRSKSGMTKERAPEKRDSDRLYEHYVRPLEQQHKGKYATVNLAGETLVAPTLLEAIQLADERFGQSQTITFKIGAKVVGKI